MVNIHRRTPSTRVTGRRFGARFPSIICTGINKSARKYESIERSTWSKFTSHAEPKSSFLDNKLRLSQVFQYRDRQDHIQGFAFELWQHLFDSPVMKRESFNDCKSGAIWKSTPVPPFQIRLQRDQLARYPQPSSSTSRSWRFRRDRRIAPSESHTPSRSATVNPRCP